MMSLSTRRIASPVGTLTLIATPHALTAVLWPNQRLPVSVDGKAKPSALLDAAEAQLHAYFNDGLRAFSLPLAPGGTLFQEAVWRALQHIPFGTTTTYQSLANTLGAPRACRAVGAAIGKNPLSIVVPCHRVIGANGKLTGFAGGLPAKEWLLRLEHALPNSGARRGARAKLDLDCHISTEGQCR